MFLISRIYLFICTTSIDQLFELARYLTVLRTISITLRYHMMRKRYWLVTLGARIHIPAKNIIRT